MTTKKVYKYAIQLDMPCTIEMPKGARVLSIQTQRGLPQMWALVDPTAPEERRHFEIYGTGHDIRNHERLLYVGTFQVEGGEFVFHVFEREAKKDPAPARAVPV